MVGLRQEKADRPGEEGEEGRAGSAPIIMGKECCNFIGRLLLSELRKRELRSATARIELPYSAVGSNKFDVVPDTDSFVVYYV